MAKDWYKSTAVWGAILVAAGGILTALGYGGVWNEIILTAGGSLSIYGIRTAKEDIK